MHSVHSPEIPVAQVEHTLAQPGLLHVLAGLDVVIGALCLNGIISLLLIMDEKGTNYDADIDVYTDFENSHM